MRRDAPHPGERDDLSQQPKLRGYKITTKKARLTSPLHFWKGAMLAGLFTVLCRVQSLLTFTISTAPLAVLCRVRRFWLIVLNSVVFA